MSAEALIGLYRSQRALYEELQELVIAQRHALLATDATALTRLTARAESLATRFRILEDERLRLESSSENQDDSIFEARQAALLGLSLLLREAAVAGTVIERIGDTLLARQGLVDPMSAPSYSATGRPRQTPTAGQSLAAEG